MDINEGIVNWLREYLMDGCTIQANPEDIATGSILKINEDGSVHCGLIITGAAEPIFKEATYDTK